MRNRLYPALALIALGAAGCQAGSFDSASAKLDTDDQKASYAIGLDMGRSLRPAESHLDRAAFMRGLEDALAKNDPAIPQEEIQAAMYKVGSQIRDEQQAKQAEAAQRNIEEGKKFLAENAQKEGVTTTESGLQYEVLREGDGPTPTADDQVTIQYRGTLLDGTEFDSSYKRGQPATFGVGGVIPGFSEGLQLMSVGSKYRFVIPAALAYGPQGSGDVIEPNATLIFEVELDSIK